MTFREYRRKETIRAAEITEEEMYLRSAGVADNTFHSDQIDEQGNAVYRKGDYVENRKGALLGYSKADFENHFAPVRAPRQSKQDRKPKRKNERVTPQLELATK